LILGGGMRGGIAYFVPGKAIILNTIITLTGKVLYNTAVITVNLMTQLSFL
jgi:hypothetical protein